MDTIIETIETAIGTFRIHEHLDTGLVLGRRVRPARTIYVAEYRTSTGQWEPQPQHGDSIDDARRAIADITAAVARGEARGTDLG